MSDARIDSRGSAIRSTAVRGGVAVVVSVVVNAGVVFSASSLGIAPDFQALSIPPVVFLSALGAVGATVVYWLLDRYSGVRNRDRAFVRLAAVVLVLSFVPDVALLWLDPAATVPGVLVLMFMHVVVAVSVVGTLVSWNRSVG